MADKDMSTGEVFSLLRNAHAYGMRGYYLFGGEPLLRRDVHEILAYAKSLGFATVINTNASLLEKKAESITDNLDFAFLSIDYPGSHNSYIRGRPRAFREVIDGARRLLELGKTKVTFVCTVSRLNLHSLDDMAEFARDMGVGVSFNFVEPTWLTGYDSGRTDSVVQSYGLTSTEIRTLYIELLRLKRKGYPLMESERVLTEYALGKPFRCDFPKIYVYVSPEGEIFPCTTRYGMGTVDLHDVSFEEYFSSREYREPARKMEECNICVRSCVRMYVYTYSLNPLHLLELVGSSSFRSLFADHQRSSQEDYLGESMVDTHIKERIPVQT